MPTHLENILRLLPETKNVAVIVGSSPVERYWASELKRDFQPFTNRVNITWFDELTLSDMLTQAATMPPNSAIFFLLLIECSRVPYTQNRALEKFREVANAPIFGLGDFELGRGVVGGPALRTQAIGERAAQVAIQILAGEPLHRSERAAAIRPPPAQLENCGGGISVKLCCRPVALCNFASRRSGSYTVGKSPRPRRLFCSRRP